MNVCWLLRYGLPFDSVDSGEAGSGESSVAHAVSSTGIRLFEPPPVASGGNSRGSGGGGATGAADATASSGHVEARVAVVADRSLIHITVATSEGQYRLQMALPGKFMMDHT